MKTIRFFSIIVIFAFTASWLGENSFASSTDTGIKIQGPSVIFYTGILKKEKIPVSHQKLAVLFEVISFENQTIVSRSVKIETDKSGLFSFYADSLPAFFIDSEHDQSVNISLSITPLEKVNMMDSKLITAKFQLKRIQGQYKFTRLTDNQEMNYAYELPIWSYSDQYPDGYLFSYFILCTGKEQCEISELIDTGARIMPRKELKRGVKGGFAVGGYKSAN